MDKIDRAAILLALIGVTILWLFSITDDRRINDLQKINAAVFELNGTQTEAIDVLNKRLTALEQTVKAESKP